MPPAARSPHSGEEPLPSQANAQGAPARASLGHHYMYEYLGLSHRPSNRSPLIEFLILLVLEQYTYLI